MCLTLDRRLLDYGIEATSSPFSRAISPGRPGSLVTELLRVQS